MYIQLPNKKTKPPFQYFVKENTSNFNYYAFNDIDSALEKARVLSLSKFPISIVLEPYKDSYNEWKMKRTFVFYNGKCEKDEEYLLHVKFYTSAGRCLNPEMLQLEPESERE